MDLNNKVVINIKDILELQDNSITDAETIRQIGLVSIGYSEVEISNDDISRLCRKIKKELTFCALYPHTQTIYDIKPDSHDQGK